MPDHRAARFAYLLSAGFPPSSSLTLARVQKLHGHATTVTDVRHTPQPSELSEGVGPPSLPRCIICRFSTNPRWVLLFYCSTPSPRTPRTLPTIPLTYLSSEAGDNMRVHFSSPQGDFLVVSSFPMLFLTFVCFFPFRFALLLQGNGSYRARTRKWTREHDGTLNESIGVFLRPYRVIIRLRSKKRMGVHGKEEIVMEENMGTGESLYRSVWSGLNSMALEGCLAAKLWRILPCSTTTGLVI